MRAACHCLPLSVRAKAMFLLSRPSSRPRGDVACYPLPAVAGASPPTARASWPRGDAARCEPRRGHPVPDAGAYPSFYHQAVVSVYEHQIAFAEQPARSRCADHRGQVLLACLGSDMVERPAGLGHQRGSDQQGQLAPGTGSAPGGFARAPGVGCPAGARPRVPAPVRRCPRLSLTPCRVLPTPGADYARRPPRPRGPRRHPLQILGRWRSCGQRS